nr:reverse transcriptase domain-containing protein [Tanacetum cinerariifolium]
MSYSPYATLSGTTLKLTRMSIRLANHTYQYPMGVAKNMLVQVGKFMFPIDLVILQMEEDDRFHLILGRPFLHTANSIIRVKNKELYLGIREDRATFLIDKAMQHSHLNDDTCFCMDVIDEVTKDELDALLEDSKPFLSTSKKISETLLDKEFEEFMTGNVQEDEVKDYFEELPPKDELRIKNSIQDLPTNLEMKPLLKHLEYAFLEENSILPKEIIKFLDTSIIYAIEDSPWVSPVHCVPKKGGMIVVTNEDNELLPTRTVTRWCVCIDYHKLNEATQKDHSPLPFMDQMLERVAGNKFFCFLNGFSRYFQIPIEPADQEKTTFTCPYGTYAYKREPFGLCNAPTTFQMCMIAIFQDMLETSIEVFVDDFLVFGDSFDSCITNLEVMLIRCKQALLVLNWEKCHFMVTEGIVLGHKVFSKGLEITLQKYMFSKQDSKPHLICLILLLQEFDIKIKNKKRAENVTADQLSGLEKPNIKELREEEINDEFLDEFLRSISTDEKESTYVDLYDKHGGSFIVHRHQVKIYHDEEQLDELTTEEIHLVCEEGRMKAIPFMAPFPANYRETMPRASKKSYIYNVVENTCNEAKLYDLDETGKGIVIENIRYVPRERISIGKK